MMLLDTLGRLAFKRRHEQRLSYQFGSGLLSVRSLPIHGYLPHPRTFPGENQFRVAMGLLVANALIQYDASILAKDFPTSTENKVRPIRSNTHTNNQKDEQSIAAKRRIVRLDF